MLHVAIAENTERKKLPKIRHLAPSHNFVGLYLHNEGTYRQSEKTYYTSSTCPHNTANFGPLTAEIGSGVWGTPANFNGFRVLASLLQRRRSPEANETLHNVWSPWADTLNIHFRGLLSPNKIFPGAKKHVTSNSWVLLYSQRYCTALQQCQTLRS